MTISSANGMVITRVRKDAAREADYRPLDLGIIRRLFSHTRTHRAIRNWLVFLVIFRSIQLPALAWAVGAVINGPISRGDVGGTVLGCAGFAALSAMTHLTFYFRQRLGLLIGERVVHDLRLMIFEHLLRMPMSFFNATKLGRIISRMTTDVEAVRVGVQDVFFVSCVQGGQTLVAGAVMLWVDYRLFAIVAVMAPAAWTLSHMFKRRMSEVSRAVQESFSRVTSTLAESVSGIRVTQSFVRQEINAAIFRDLVTDHSRYNLDAARTSGIFTPLLELSSQFVAAALLIVSGVLMLQLRDPMPLGSLIQVFFLSGVFFSGIQSLGRLYNSAMASMAGAERVFRFLDMKPEWEDDPNARDLPAVKGRVECRNVTFGYDPRRPVLLDVSFTAAPGQTVAVVGHTGSGKTSLINLISKFYLANAGDILVDGVSIRDIRAESLHRQMALIHQQNFLFTGTVMENIRIGRPGAGEAEVVDAARKLDCLDIIEGLAQGFSTEVGERGASLSPGQRQLVCFVRAMLADPRILILDEATSSIDTLTEVRIQKALSQLIKGRTCFVIAHRLSTVRHADFVIVLDRGRIAERGTHAELLAKRGIYSGLYRQFARLGLGGIRPPP
jgi:ATP-binding cassette subfamily B protein